MKIALEASKLKRRWNWKKPIGKPKRNCSTYNYFYQHVNNRMKKLSGGKKIGGLELLSSVVSKEWRELKMHDSDPVLLAECELRAANDLARYRNELAAWELSNGNGENHSREVALLMTHDSALNNPVILNSTTETPPMTGLSMPMPDDGERSMKSQNSVDDFGDLGDVYETSFDQNSSFSGSDFDSLDEEPLEGDVSGFMTELSFTQNDCDEPKRSTIDICFW